MNPGVPNVTLFIVPWPWAGTGTARPSADMTTSTIRLDVSVFPPTTAAGGRAFTRHPSGATTSTGTNAPPDAGMSGSQTDRTQK